MLVLVHLRPQPAQVIQVLEKQHVFPIYLVFGILALGVMCIIMSLTWVPVLLHLDALLKVAHVLVQEMKLHVSLKTILMEVLVYGMEQTVAV